MSLRTEIWFCVLLNKVHVKTTMGSEDVVGKSVKLDLEISGG